VSDLAVCVLAGNPSAMTLDGTNSWVLSAPDADRCIVVDPGPDDPTHREALLAAVAACSTRVGVVLLTHGHPDHAEGAVGFAEASRADGRTPAVRALDPAFHLGSEGLVDGDVVADAGLEVSVIATPGHTADSLSFLLRGPGATAPDLLTGDTVLGRGSSVVAFPEGRLAAYLESLDRLSVVCEATDVARLLPGHGPVLDRPADVLEAYKEHRRERLEQIAAAMRGGARTAADVVAVVYADVDQALWPAAAASVRAQLAYLTGQ
jgi:glyoxylase-like metal-dependent hydrolase (beta-lactamase superfamily II)